MKKYTPIACQLHDQIEHFATLRKAVDIHYENESGEPEFIQSTIKDWINDGEGEYLIIDKNDTKIRFDRIISIENIEFGSFDSCKIS